MTRKVYEHQPLSASDSIRLLRISRDEKLPHGISLSLTEAHLDDEPEFTALSYTWDLPHYVDAKRQTGEGPGETFEVICDGKSMTISENLFDFLCSALVACDRPSTTKNHTTKLTPKVDDILATLPIWIDAFCINQVDADEKRHQVLVMHRIYSAARNVIIWLGSTQPTADVIWVHDKFIPAVFRVVNSKPDFVRSHLSGDPALRLPGTVEELGSGLCFRWLTAWLAFSLFIDRQRWFDRGWVVQEVALADPASVYVLCGRAALSWKRLAAFALFLQDTGWSRALSTQLGNNRLLDRGEYSDNHFKYRVARPMDPGLKMSKVSQARRSLSEVVQRTGLLDRNFGSSDRQSWEAENAWWSCADLLINSLRSSQFSDPRDHIYGCLGMLSMILPEGVDSPIIPDYSRSVEEVFTATATELIRELPLFWEISQVGLRSTQRHKNLPSWVPDYSSRLDQSATPNRTFALNRYRGLGLEELKRVERDLWGIVRDKKRNEDFPRVRATYIATVSLVGADKPYEWESKRLKDKILDKYFSNWGRSLGEMLSEVVTFWHALRLFMNHGYRDEHRALEMSRRRREQFPTEPHVLLDSTPGFRQASTNDLLRLDELERSVKSELTRRYLYMTKSDGLGLGPLATQPEDEIWLVHGAWAPFILRKVRPDAYEFVGETDYDGLDIQSARYRNLSFQQIWLV